MPSLSATEKMLIHHLSGDLGESLRPYADLAAKTGLTEEEVLRAVARFQERGYIRRFGATLWHQRSGFAANAMVVFQVTDQEAETVGPGLARLPYVSHCYLRRTVPAWPYNLYAMIHAESQAALSAMIAEMAALAGTEHWRVLASVRELKKASLRYFTNEAQAQSG